MEKKLAAVKEVYLRINQEDWGESKFNFERTSESDLRFIRAEVTAAFILKLLKEISQALTGIGEVSRLISDWMNEIKEERFPK